MAREILVPVGFRLPLDIIKAIDDECTRLDAGRSTWRSRTTRSEVIVAALRRALPPQSDEQKKKKKPSARRAA